MVVRIVLALGLLIFPLSGTSTGQTPPPVDRWIPDRVLLTLEIGRPEVLFELLRDETIVEQATTSSAWEAFSKTPDYQKLRFAVSYLEGALGVDWRTALEQLAGGGVTLAIGPNKEAMAIVEARDADLLGRLHEIVLTFVGNGAAKAKDGDRVRSEKRGLHEVWTFDGKEEHAIVGSRFLLANRPGLLDSMLKLADGTDDASLAASDRYREARATAGPGSAAFLWADFARLKHLPDLARALEEGSSNPLAALMTGGVPKALREASWLTTTLYVRSGGFSLRARTDGSAAGAAGATGFAWPGSAGDGLLPNLDVPGRIAAGTFYRDLHRFYAGKDELFPERTSALIFFENMMGIFFSGRDLTDEVFKATRPDVRFVVAEQRYDEKIGTPEVKIPAFAAIIGVRDAESFGVVLEEAWQKALGLINFTRGQQAQPGLIIDREIHGGTKYTFAYFSSREVDNRAQLHERFNYRPTLAVAGGRVVLSSTDTLARDLIDALMTDGTVANTPPPELNTLFEVDGPPLSAILSANREALVHNNMIDEGNTREAAEAAIDVLLEIARYIGSISLSLGSDGKHTFADLDVRLNRVASSQDG